MNFRIMDKDSLTLYKANSPPFYLEKLPINNVYQLSKGIALERRGSTDSGVDLTEAQSVIGEKRHHEELGEASAPNSIKHEHNLRKSTSWSSDILPEEDIDYSFRNGNIECFFENFYPKYPFGSASRYGSFEDIDLIHCSEDMILEAYIEEREDSKKTTSIIGMAKNSLYHIIKMIVEPHKLPLYIYTTLILIVFGILNCLKNILYTRPLAIYTSLRSAA